MSAQCALRSPGHGGRHVRLSVVQLSGALSGTARQVPYDRRLDNGCRPAARPLARQAGPPCSSVIRRPVVTPRLDDNGDVAQNLARFRLIWTGHTVERAQQVSRGLSQVALALRAELVSYGSAELPLQLCGRTGVAIWRGIKEGRGPRRRLRAHAERRPGGSWGGSRISGRRPDRPVRGGLSSGRASDDGSPLDAQSARSHTFRWRT